MIVDNRYVEGSGTSISRIDAAGNTYQQRTLSTHATFEVLENFPSPDDVRDVLKSGIRTDPCLGTTAALAIPAARKTRRQVASLLTTVSHAMAREERRSDRAIPEHDAESSTRRPTER